MSDERFNLEITSGHIVLTADQIWPDGDGPDNPTAEDVLARIEADGGALTVLDGWFLDDNMMVYCSEVKPRPRTVVEAAAEATPIG
ncbi:MAG: hypothetical protein DRQ42_08030 [Gammaproteobacteria bacterium]|nr:MAG: hypothetical protein DRQ42_08030 [Gammaproteobacteria bacterium]